MNFWWYFIPFLLIPFIVHLFSFRGARKLYFSSIKYITGLASKTKSKSKLKYILILSNRFSIFLVLLVLIWLLLGSNSNSSLKSGLTAVYFDNSVSGSLSMSDAILEQGVNSLLKERRTILFFDNNNRSLLDVNTDFSRKENLNASGMKMNRLFSQIQEIGASNFYLLSDYQQVESSFLREMLLDSTKSYEVIITNDLNEERNVSIDSLYLIPNPDNLSELSVIASFNAYNMKEGNVVVKLMQNSRQLSSVVKDVTELDEVRFDVSKESYGSFEVLIDGDGVNYDNTFYFNVGEKSRPQVEVLTSKPNRVLSEVFGNSELFHLSNQDISNINYEAMTGADLIVIANQYSLPQNLLQQFDDKNFLLIPPDSIDVKRYEDFIGIELESRSENSVEISVDSNHPLFSGVFEKQVDEGGMPQERALLFVQGSYEPIIKYRDGSPFLLRKEGIYFFNAALGSKASNFQSNALFLTVMYQIAFATVGDVDQPYYYPGELISINSKPSDIPVRIVSANYEVIPSFNSSGSEMILELPEDIEPGQYALVQEGDTLQQLSVNLPKQESVMRAPKFEELQELFSDMPHVRVSEIVESESDVLFAGNAQSSLWKYALILMICLVLTETALHRYLR